MIEIAAVTVVVVKVGRRCSRAVVVVTGTPAMDARYEEGYEGCRTCTSDEEGHEGSHEGEGTSDEGNEEVSHYTLRPSSGTTNRSRFPVTGDIGCRILCVNHSEK